MENEERFIIIFPSSISPEGNVVPNVSEAIVSDDLIYFVTKNSLFYFSWVYNFSSSPIE